jgi:hypothetical protein
MSNAALVQVLEHEKMMAKGARMCMIVGDEPIRNVVQKICGIFRALFAPLFL